MSNHIHLLATPAVPLPTLTRSLKGITAKRANAILRLSGNSLLARGELHHPVRNTEIEFLKNKNLYRREPSASRTGNRSQRISMVERGEADRGVARGPRGPPHKLSSVASWLLATGYWLLLSY